MNTLSWRASVAVILGLLPWLNPWTPGPSHALVGWLLSGLACAAWLLCRPMAAPHPGLLGYFALLALSIASHPGYDLGAWAQALASVGLLACAAAVGATVQNRRALVWLAVLWLLAASFNSLIGGLQYLDWDSLLPGLNHAGVGQAFGHLRQRNQFATLTSMGVAVLLMGLWPVSSSASAGMQAPATGAANLRGLGLKLAWPALALWLALGNALSQSRTGLLELIGLVLMSAAWRHGRQRSAPAAHDATDHRLWLAMVLALALGYGLGAWWMPQVISPASVGGALIRMPEDLQACQSRWALWHNVLDLIRLRPWQGWGWGELDVAHYSHLYAQTRFCGIVDNAHNLPLQWAVELGVPWTLLLLTLGLLACWRARPWRETRPERQLAWALLAVLGLHSLLEFPLWYGPFQLSLGLCLGLLWPSRTAAPIARASAAGLAALWLIGGLYVAWDYWRITQLYLPHAQRAPAYAENTLAKVWDSVLFRSQVQFAEVGTTPVTADNATRMQQLSQIALHYSPEPMVVEKLMDSALLTRNSALVQEQLPLFLAAFPYIQQHWVAQHAAELATLRPAPASGRP